MMQHASQESQLGCGCFFFAIQEREFKWHLSSHGPGVQSQLLKEKKGGCKCFTAIYNEILWYILYIYILWPDMSKKLVQPFSHKLRARHHFLQILPSHHIIISPLIYRHHGLGRHLGEEKTIGPRVFSGGREGLQQRQRSPFRRSSDQWFFEGNVLRYRIQSSKGKLQHQ